MFTLDPVKEDDGTSVPLIAVLLPTAVVITLLVMIAVVLVVRRKKNIKIARYDLIGNIVF